MRFRTVVALSVSSVAAVAACATPDLTEEGVALPARKDATVSDGTSPSDASESEGSARDAGGGASDAPTGPTTCGLMNGLNVICMRAGETFAAASSVSYGPGFPTGLPAMGLGKPALGYLPNDYPLTCTAKAGLKGLSANNTAGGKICEVVFDNNVAQTTTGTATYDIKVDPGAALGTYEVAYTANTGATPAVSGFFVKILP